MSRWPKVTLSDCLQPASDVVPVERDREYPNFGIYSYARGLFHKRPINGLASSALTLRRVRRRQFVYSRLFAFEGAYGIVGDDFDGCFVSNEYPTFDCDETRILPEYLIAYFSVPRVWEAVAKGSKGLGVRRQRVQPEHVLSHAISLAPLSEQRTIVERLDALEEKKRQVAAKLDAIDADSDHLLAMRFGEAIVGADWKPIGDVAPVVRRNVKISVDRRYREIGARSFGRGLFVKPDFNGADATWQKPVWIEKGDDLAVTNIVPKSVSQLSRQRYNLILAELFGKVAEPACRDLNLLCTLTEESLPITHWISEEAASRLLRFFSRLANKATGSAHPLDRKRWFAFISQTMQAESISGSPDARSMAGQHRALAGGGRSRLDKPFVMLAG
jgi:hypothetical protein